MSTSWHIFKYIADPRRGETVNVGVVLHHEGRHFLRFRDVVDGRLSTAAARRWCGEPQNFLQWTRFLSEHFSSTEPPFELKPRPGDNYALVPSGQVSHGEVDPEALLDELFTTLVAPPSKFIEKPAG